MRKLLYLLPLSLLFFVTACGDDDVQAEETAEVNLNFKATYDGDDFYTENIYKLFEGVDDTDIKFSTFDFFIGNVSLIKNVGEEFEETELLEIDFVSLSFDPGQAAQAEAGVTIQGRKVPAGTYDGIKIGFGVPADLNRTSPSEYGSGDVLSKTSHYWSGWDSYIFAKLEGLADHNGNGVFETSGVEEGFTYHMGTDETFTERTIFQTITLEVDEERTVNLNLDVRKLFRMTLSEYDQDDNDLLDVEDFPGTHTDAELQINKTMMNNFSDAVSLQE